MIALLENRRSEVYQLLIMGVKTTTVVALSYDYVATTGTAKAFFVIFGAGWLLALLVIAPVLLMN